MRIPVELTYEMVAERHPAELEKIIKQLRKSKSKMKDADPKGMRFEYSYAMRCDISYRGDEFFDAIANGTLDQPKRPTTVEGKVADWVERSTPVALKATLGRWYGYEVVPNPPELEETFRRDAEEEVKRETRIANMTPAERNDETQRILSELSGGGGFLAITKLK
jgi:hypothetical protein